MELLVDMYNSVPPGFTDEPWIYHLGRLLWNTTFVLLGVRLGIHMEREKKSKRGSDRKR